MIGCSITTAKNALKDRGETTEARQVADTCWHIAGLTAFRSARSPSSSFQCGEETEGANDHPPGRGAEAHRLKQHDTVENGASGRLSAQDRADRRRFGGLSGESEVDRWIHDRVRGAGKRPPRADRGEAA